MEESAPAPLPFTLFPTSIPRATTGVPYLHPSIPTPWALYREPPPCKTPSQNLHLQEMDTQSSDPAHKQWPPSLSGSSKDHFCLLSLLSSQLPLSQFPSKKQLPLGSQGGHRISCISQKSIKQPQKTKKKPKLAGNLPAVIFWDEGGKKEAKKKSLQVISLSKVAVYKYNQDKTDIANSSFSLLNELFNSPLILFNCFILPSPFLIYFTLFSCVEDCCQ